PPVRPWPTTQGRLPGLWSASWSHPRDDGAARILARLAGPGKPRLDQVTPAGSAAAGPARRMRAFTRRRRRDGDGDGAAAPAEQLDELGRDLPGASALADSRSLSGGEWG